MEEAQAVPMVVAMDLEVEVVDMVAEGFKIKQKRLQFLAGERARSCRKAAGYVETVVPNALEEL